MDTASEHPRTGAIIKAEPGTMIDVTTPQISWTGITLAWMAELRQRTGSERTPTEYGRYAEHFLDMLTGLGRDLDHATPADVHAFAYASLPDRRRGGRPGKPPGPASVNVRLAAIRSLYDFARRMGAVKRKTTARTDVMYESGGISWLR